MWRPPVQRERRPPTSNMKVYVTEEELIRAVRDAAEAAGHDRSVAGDPRGRCGEAR